MRRRVQFFIGLVLLQLLLLSPAAIWPGYLDSPIGAAIMLFYLLVYLASSLGIPGLLAHQGHCEWGWCPPSIAGWCFIVFVWLLVNWGTAAVLAKIFPARPARNG
ncbi:MAG TPA: hypothetical protein VHL14_06350 [Steroidobacteraceae bacterium]|nr:hypothetical protein [Steroidobacteraceae bacterium]